MDIVIRNCNNIDFGSIHVQEGCLNIKYAANGTGKSTIANAMALWGSRQPLTPFLPYKYSQQKDPPAEQLPTIECSIDNLKVAIFNEEYVNQYIFQGDELIKGSFDIFIKTPDYDHRMEEIKRLIKSVQDVFQSNPDINDFITELTSFLRACGNVKKGYAKSSSLGKGLAKGNKIDNVPVELYDYTPYIQSSKNVLWINWQSQGKEFADITNLCPYCANPLPPERKELAFRVAEEYDAKTAEHIVETVKLFHSMEHLFSSQTNEKINELIKNASGFSDEQEHFIEEIRSEVQVLVGRLVDIQNISFEALKNDKHIEVIINQKKIDFAYLPHLNNDYMQAKVSAINAALEQVLERATALQAEIGKQNTAIRRTIQQNKSEIDIFLKNAGYKYHVELQERNKTYCLVLIPDDSMSTISNVKSHLSYGERNAFALILFMYSQLKASPDIIILDDPISSFDKNKKYAILDMLFHGNRSLKNKTVIMLTHDFDPVVDLIHEPLIRRTFQPKPRGSFLWNANGILQEKEITASDIIPFYVIADKVMESDIDEIHKTIFLRRRMEACNEKGAAWDIISSLLHKRPIPKKQDEQFEEYDLSDEELNSGLQEIRSFLPGFDYNRIIRRMTDQCTLIELYEQATCGYEKVQLYRLFDCGGLDNPVAKKYIDESYHVENDSLFQLDPMRYETVPEFIVDFCDTGVALIKQGMG